MLVKITLSVETAQGALVIDHLNVALVPTGTVTAEVGEEGVAIVGVPLTILQRPVPGAGELPASVKLELLHCV